MKTASTDLIGLLNGGQNFLMADLYTFTLVDGAEVRYTDADRDLQAGGQVFSATGPLLRRSGIRSVIGVEVDTLTIDMMAQAQHTLTGIPWLAAIRNGVLDGARVQLERVFMPTWGDTSAGTVVLFSGRVAEADVGRTSATITVKSDLELLDIQMPRNLYQAGCLNVLFDASCGVSKAACGVASTVSAGSSQTILKCGLSQAATHFDIGTVRFTSGANINLTRSIRAYIPGQITLALPLASACAVGDTFIAYPGCDKTRFTCAYKFDNYVNFRGFPFVPPPESVR